MSDEKVYGTFDQAGLDAAYNNSAAEASIGETVTLSAESLRAVLDPRAIVESRSDGGPAPKALRERLERAAKQLENDLAALKEVQVRIETSRADLEREVDALIGG